MMAGIPTGTVGGRRDMGAEGPGIVVAAVEPSFKR